MKSINTHKTYIEWDATINLLMVIDKEFIQGRISMLINRFQNTNRIVNV